jgi:hypothetical protein
MVQGCTEVPVVLQLYVRTIYILYILYWMYVSFVRQLTNQRGQAGANKYYKQKAKNVPHVVIVAGRGSTIGR